MNRSKLRNELTGIKQKIDTAITDPNESLQYSIRGKDVIGPIEDFVAEELVNTYDFDSTSVKQDVKVYGKTKTKEHDIVISPDSIRESYLQGGKYIESMGPMMVISCRSQTKSLDKNYDTIYERLVAEPGELHGRYPHTPFGMLHMLSAQEYEESNNTKVTNSYNLEKWLNFNSSEIGRSESTEPINRPEAMHLLIVDFESNPPSILDTTQQLVNKGLISRQFENKRGSWVESNLLSLESFFDTLVSCLDDRYPLVSESIRS